MIHRSTLTRSIRLTALLLSLTAVQAVVADTAHAGGACKWLDGHDPAAPADDPGRGVTDWTAHRDHVLKGKGLANAHALVTNRLTTLKGCLDKDAYARLYADASILVAHYGRTYAGWKDASDATAPADDPGRGIALWQAHVDHVMIGVGMTNADKLVGDRLRALSGKLTKEVYGRLYADLSILLVNAARIEAPAPMAPVKRRATPCVWADAQDPSGPGDDRGRGVADWTAHQGYVLGGPGLTTAAQLVNNRLSALKACLDKPAYARLYADASILIGYHGRRGAGWLDGRDAAAPADDPGRGVARWQAHLDHVMVGVGLTNADKLVGDRLRTLSGKLSKDAYARLYADLSILIANHARAS